MVRPPGVLFLALDSVSLGIGLPDFREFFVAPAEIGGVVSVPPEFVLGFFAKPGVDTAFVKGAGFFVEVGVDAADGGQGVAHEIAVVKVEAPIRLALGLGFFVVRNTAFDPGL